MALPTLYGPFPLTTDGVNNAVTAKNTPGVYALGYTRENTFYIGYVGRSDECVHQRLCDHVTLSDPQFKVSYCASATEAFYAECELYHAYGGSRNPNHPARPKGTNLRCPRLDCPV